MKRNEKGQVLVLVALAIFVLLGLAALGIDVGFMYSRSPRTPAQRGRRRAGGRFGVHDGRLERSDDRPVTDDRGRPRKGLRFERQGGHDDAGSGSEVAVSFPVSMDRIEVITSTNATCSSRGSSGWPNQLITARAVAEAAVADRENVQCIKPWGIPYPWTMTPIG